MNIEEFRAVLDKLRDAMHGGTDVLRGRGWASPNDGLAQVYRELERYRLEMEADEAKPTASAPTLVDVGDLATRRDLERIEKRLGEIETQLAGHSHGPVYYDAG